MLLLILLSNAWAAPTLRAGLLGEFVTHPGAFISFEPGRSDRPGLAPVVGGRLGGYVHPGHHSALFVHGEGGLRLSGSQVAADVLVGAGLHHRWLPTRVVVRRGETVASVLDAGRPNLLGTLGLRIGDADGRVRPFGRADLAWRGPVHRGVRTELLFAIGVAIKGAS
ncbi:MAG: hypothetical protein AAGA48_37590 [Myxococcota bacterium]